MPESIHTDVPARIPLRRRRKAWLIAAFIVFDLVVFGTIGVKQFVLPSHALLPGISGCHTLTNREQAKKCVAQRTTSIVNEQGVERGLAEVSASAKKYPNIATDCHSALHLVSARIDIPLKAGFTTAKRVQNDCSDGLAHGLVAKALATGSTDLIGDVAGFCTSRWQAGSGKRVDCVHGMGHGIYQRLGLADGLQACDRPKWFSSQDDSENCYSGVFMQDTMDEPSKPTTAALLERCERPKLTQSQSETCYFYVGGNAAQLGMQYPQIATTCTGASLSWGARMCVKGLGQLQGPDTPQLCGGLSAELYGSCLKGYLQQHLAYTKRESLKQSAARCNAGKGASAAACADAVGYALAHPQRVDKGTVTECDVFTNVALGDSCRSGYREEESYTDRATRSSASTTA